MYNIRLFGIVTMNHPIQRIYPNKKLFKKGKNKMYVRRFSFPYNWLLFQPLQILSSLRLLLSAKKPRKPEHVCLCNPRTSHSRLIKPLLRDSTFCPGQKGQCLPSPDNLLKPTVDPMHLGSFFTKTATHLWINSMNSSKQQYQNSTWSKGYSLWPQLQQLEA
jgi:hypothetical protein